MKLDVFKTVMVYTALALLANAGYTIYDGGDTDAAAGYAYGGILSLVATCYKSLGKKIALSILILCLWISRAAVGVVQASYEEIPSEDSLIYWSTTTGGTILSLLSLAVQTILKRRKTKAESESISPVKLRFLV
jgi:hypothetical protein